MRRHLLGRDLDGRVVEATLAELVESGYVDDARYARMFTADKRRLEQWGSERIRRALLTRGVESELIDAALLEDGDAAESGPGHEADSGAGHEADPTARDGPDHEDAAESGALETGELGRALGLLARRFPSPPVDRRERQRALGALIRRGYDPDLASDAIAAYSRSRG